MAWNYNNDLTKYKRIVYQNKHDKKRQKLIEKIVLQWKIYLYHIILSFDKYHKECLPVSKHGKCNKNDNFVWIRHVRSTPLSKNHM